MPALSLKGKNARAHLDSNQQNYSTVPSKAPYFEQISRIESGAFEANEIAGNAPFQQQDLFTQ